MASGDGIPKLPPMGHDPRMVATRVNQLIDRGLHEGTEAVIGTWVDGKPIYRKVVSVGAGPNSTTKNTAHSTSALGTVTEIRGVMDNGTTQMPVPWGNGTNSTGIEATDTNVSIVTDWNASAYTTYAIMEYTKTTD